MADWFSARIKLYFRLIMINWIIFNLLRLLFFFNFKSTLIEGNLADFAKAFYLGSKFDLRFSILLALPIILFSWLPGLNIKYSKFAGKIWRSFYVFAAFMWLCLYAADLANYEYLNARINSSLITFLYNPIISMGMIWENYPILKLSLFLIIFLALYRYLLRTWVFKMEFPAFKIQSLRPYIGSALFIIFLFAGLYGKMAFFPLRWSESFFSKDKFVSAIGVNPVLYLVETFKHSEMKYDLEKVKKYYPLISDYLGVENKNINNLNFQRFVPESKKWEKAPNVVVIVMESFTSYKTSLLANPLDAGPSMANLAKQGIYFSEYYVPVEGSARSIFALVSGVADVSKPKTASRNPVIVEQNLIMNFFDGYKKMYFLGGSANWANIRGVFTQNVNGIEIMEEGKYDSPRTDVWGLSDYHLFLEADKKFQNTNEPFFAVIQSSSYHRPYTIPEDAGDFKYDERPLDELKKWGFISNQEYNSFRFSDYSLGEFFKHASKSNYFENTLFVITGDHGVPDNGAESLPLARRTMQNAKWNVPLIFYSPALIKEAKEIKAAASEVDVMPTIASWVGVSYINTGMGRDLFDPKFDNKRYAFTYTHYLDNDYGLIGDGLFFKNASSGDRGLFDYSVNEIPKDLSAEKEEKYKEMAELADGLYETAKYLLFHNKPAKKIDPENMAIK